MTDKSTTSDRLRACAFGGKMRMFHTSKGVHNKKVCRASTSKSRRVALLSHTSGKDLESNSLSGFPGRWHLQQTLLVKGSAHCCPATWAGARSLCRCRQLPKQSCRCRHNLNTCGGANRCIGRHIRHSPKAYRLLLACTRMTQPRQVPWVL